MPKNTDVDHNHPIAFLRKLAEKLPCDHKFVFEIYKRTNKKYGSYEIGQVAGDLTADELLDSFEELKNFVVGMIQSTELKYGTDYELGIQTKSIGYGHQIYIPCIDLIGQPSKERLSSLLEEASSLIGSENFWIFDSGRSYHVYAETLISPLKNKRFFEILKKYPDVVDLKWVEHSTSKGYGILRWSAISSYHNNLPRLKEKLRFV